jgi:hypothetical protein
MNKAALIGLCVLLFAVVSSTASNAEIKPNMKDHYIRREFEWSAFIHAAEAKNYLTYNFSTLKPLTKVSVAFREGSGSTVLYEEFFYTGGKVLGLHRRKQLVIDKDRVGAIVLGGERLGEPSSGRAVVNALARVMLDFQLRRLVTDVVIVPQENYHEVVQYLAKYGFRANDIPPSDGEQFSFTLRSTPYGFENRMFLSR